MNRVQKKFSVLAMLIAAMVMGFGAGSVKAQGNRQAFLNQFQKAVADNDFAGQRKLVSENKEDSFGAFFDIEISMLKARLASETENSNKAYKELDSLASNYRLVYSDPLLGDRLRFVNTLEGEKAQARIDAYNAFSNGVQSHNQGKNGNEEAYDQALESYSNAFVASYQIKDYYRAAKSAEFISSVYVIKNIWFEAAYFAKWCQRCAVEGGLHAREEFAWIETFLKDLHEKKRVSYPELIDVDIRDIDEAKKAHVKAVEDKTTVKIPGTGEVGTKGGGGEVKLPPSASAPFEWADFKFKNSTEKNLWTKIKLPYYNVNAVNPQNGNKHPFYQFQQFDKVDKNKPEPTDFRGFPGGKIVYDGDFNFSTDVDKENAKVKNKFGKLALDVKYDDGAKLKITHMMMDYESTRLELFGTKFTASDAAKTALVAWYGTSTATGKIFGHEVTIVDTNGNGLIRDAGEDSIIIGSGKNARIEPFGRYIYLPEEDGWYPYQITIGNKIGTDIRVRPYRGPLAPITVKYSSGSGKMPDYLIAKGTGEDTEFYFDLMKAIDPTQPIWVPVGGYEIYQGYFSFGSGKKETNILIGKGRSAVFKVQAGDVNTWELGGAGEQGFWMIGEVRRSAEDKTELVCVGKDIRVFGSYGEEYFNFFEERVQPVITIHRDGAEGKKVGEEEMRMPSGNGVTLAELWFPANCTIKNAPKNDKLFAQLTAKHGILGQIKSAWFQVID